MRVDAVVNRNNLESDEKYAENTRIRWYKNGKSRWLELANDA